MLIEHFLLHIGAARGAQAWKSKSVTFVQNQWSDSCKTIDDQAFETVAPADGNDWDLSLISSHRAKAAVMFCEMMGRPRSILNDHPYFWDCGSLKQRRALFGSGIGKRDHTLTKQTLRTGKAIVNLPVAELKQRRKQPPLRGAGGGMMTGAGDAEGGGDIF